MALTALHHPDSDLSPVALLPMPKLKKFRCKKRTDLYQDVTGTVIRELNRDNSTIKNRLFKRCVLACYSAWVWGYA